MPGITFFSCNPRVDVWSLSSLLAARRLSFHVHAPQPRRAYVAAAVPPGRCPPTHARSFAENWEACMRGGLDASDIFSVTSLTRASVHCCAIQPSRIGKMRNAAAESPGPALVRHRPPPPDHPRAAVVCAHAPTWVPVGQRLSVPDFSAAGPDFPRSKVN
ncbi:hypothetical protein CCHR01_09075 [Colletotrichum chrysophilum]|uniref:Uncharacterized protein n=1 Tax=Colletotrichum chrysophilum TaxID=1836956 RepID=A0AAD9AHT7_9PEZI|nr:hypothetical protein CCHR01_09075 [Colletotrichum chrysophilum]